MESCIGGCFEWCGCIGAAEPIQYLVRHLSRTSIGTRTSHNITDALIRQKSETIVNDLEIDIETLLLRQNAKRDICKYYEVNLDKKFGEGAYGQVYQAVHIETGSVRAVKILKKMDAVNWKLITAELSALIKLDHPNVIKIYEFFENENELFMVTEACYGGEVTSVILGESDALKNRSVTLMDIFAQIVAAVRYCHLQDIAHRDLKLDNCLFKSNETGVIKVIDFGLAGFKKKKSKLNYFNQFMGTALYAAPEILAQKPYSQLVDNWSLGIILYLLFTGMHPFQREGESLTQDKLFERVKNDQYFITPLDKATVSAPVRNIIDGLLQKKPEDRLSLEEILLDPIVTRPHKTPNRPKLDLMELHSNLLAFASLSRFDRAVMLVIAHGAHSRDLEELRKMFMQIDVNKSGKLDKDELLNGLHKIIGAHTFLTTEELDLIFDSINSSGTGSISYTEWLTACLSRCLLEQDDSIKKAFEFFDEDKDGKLTFTELRKTLGIEHSEDTLESIGDENGVINYEGFRKYVLHVAEKRAQATPELAMYAPTGFGMVSLATIVEEIDPESIEDIITPTRNLIAMRRTAMLDKQHKALARVRSLVILKSHEIPSHELQKGISSASV